MNKPELIQKLLEQELKLNELIFNKLTKAFEFDTDKDTLIVLSDVYGSSFDRLASLRYEKNNK